MMKMLDKCTAVILKRNDKQERRELWKNMHTLLNQSLVMKLLAFVVSPWRIDPYTHPIPGWMRECKQKLAPIFVLVD
jgi:hypothetical protein